ncbi:flagellar hook-length control protein FliK [Helicobacter sp. 11S03491-1]|uniref:flagellar hook-length control protein FliK n=1 Tax=Helicobacter sp. 11S03491-1 TaxID=1476196 RepID=UPI000BA646D2|nr:flagellar hook-length control protein FliK [Helicobacter sp. 11S03491-1]PAF42582.1 hypothetical protein BKH45_03450 [Helicobacter sp. 11S03491-1]
MIENILNNVNAAQTQEMSKTKKETKKTSETSQDGDSFTNLLHKNTMTKIEKDNKTPSTQNQKNEKKTLENTSKNTPTPMQNTSSKESLPLEMLHTKDINEKKPLSQPLKDMLSSKSMDKDSDIKTPKKNISDIKTLADEKNTPTPMQNTSSKESLPLEMLHTKDINEKKPLSQPLKNMLSSKSMDKDSDIKTPKKNISDIKTLADEKNIQIKNIKLSNASDVIDKSDMPASKNEINSSSKEAQNLTKPLTQNVLDQKLKTQNSKSTSTKQDKTLSSVLAKIDEKELKARKKFNQNHKIKYKTEDKTEKIAIIERGSHLPKNIVDPKIYQEKREANLEKLQSKNTSFQEGISQDFIKDIKLANLLKDEEKTTDTKDSTQKKTKKSGNILKPSKLSGSMIDSSNTPTKLQDQNKQIENQIAMEKNNIQISSLEKKQKKQNDKEVQEFKEKPKENISQTKDMPITSGNIPKNDLLYKSAQAKQTIKNFAQNFNEEIKKYKPPMSKISLELHPEKLGKLELTIKQMGNNLHVSVISNNQAIALFIQNQAELRQNLAMIGFGGVDLNFSSQENSQKDQQNFSDQKRNKNSLKQYKEIKNVSEIPYDTMEIILPKYA